MSRRDAAIAILLASVAAGCAETGRIRLSCRPLVPREFRTQPPELDPPPNGEPEWVRYTVAYEAYWWNCVMLRADNLAARCPFQCSGTPAAAAGCADGANTADQGIRDLLAKFPGSEVQKYLRSIAAQPEAKRKMKPYFQGGPEPERVPE